MGDGGLGEADRLGQIAHARLPVGLRGDHRQQPDPGRITQRLEHPRQPLRVLDREHTARHRGAASSGISRDQR